MPDDRAPVQQTPLSQQGKSLQPGIVTARRGLLTNISNMERGSDFARDLNNMQMLRPGVWTNQGIGWLKDRDAAFDGAFREFSFFVDNTGTRTLIFQSGAKLQSYDLTTHTETDIITGLSLSLDAVPTLRRSYSPTTGASIMIYTNGDIEPRKVLTTSTEAALAFNGGVWPGAFNGKTYSKPKFCEPFGERFVYAGFPGAATAFDVLISDQADPESFTISTPSTDTDAVAFTYPPELGALKTIRTHTINNDLSSQIIIGGCTDGIFAIFGSTASEFGLRILTRQLGIINNRCWVNLGDDLLYLSNAGIRNFNGLAVSTVLAPDALSYPIADLVADLDLDYAHLAHACHNPRTQEIQFWCPITGGNGQVKKAFILKYESAGGQVIPIWSTKDGTEVSASIFFKSVMYGGDSAAVLQKHYSGNTYNGTTITSRVALPLINVGNVQQKCSIRNISIVTDGDSQKFNFVAYVYSRLDDNSFVRTAAEPGSTLLETKGGSTTALGSWILGSGAFPSTHPKILDFQPIGNGTFWDFEITTSADDHALDLAGVAYTLSGGSLQR
jgi:hypothetical protein